MEESHISTHEELEATVQVTLNSNSTKIYFVIVCQLLYIGFKKNNFNVEISVNL